jgi:cytidylate kinase
MNVVEAYTQFKGQLIIVISGIAGSNKNKIAKIIANSLKLQLIKQIDYYKPSYDKKITRPDGIEIINLNTDDVIDWDKFNNDVNHMSQKGVILSVSTLPNNMINFTVDYHIHLAISKQNYAENREKYLTRYKDDNPQDFSELNTQIDKWKINQNYMYYKNSINNMNIHKFITVNNSNAEGSDIIDNIWNDIIYNHIVPFTEQFVNSPDYDKWKKSQNNDKKIKLQSIVKKSLDNSNNYKQNMNTNPNDDNMDINNNIEQNDVMDIDNDESQNDGGHNDDMDIDNDGGQNNDMDIDNDIGHNNEMDIDNDIGQNNEMDIDNDIGQNNEMDIDNDIGQNNEMDIDNDIGQNNEMDVEQNGGGDGDDSSINEYSDEHLGTYTDNMIYTITDNHS